MAKLVVTENDRMQLIGLLSVGAQLLHQLNTVDQAMCRLLDVQPDFGSYSGHINDTLYESDTHNPVHLADALLAKLHIDVLPVSPAPEVEVTGPSQDLETLVRSELPTGLTLTPRREEPPF